jgi:hypothetical protein
MNVEPMMACLLIFSNILLTQKAPILNESYSLICFNPYLGFPIFYPFFFAEIEDFTERGKVLGGNVKGGCSVPGKVTMNPLFRS